MKYYIYQMTNNVNGKIYVGKSSCECNPEDHTSYTGSGKLLIRAKKKYGLENFTKEILHVFVEESEAYSKEQEIVDMNFVNREDTYNLCTGGLGGMEISEETRKKQSIAQKKSMARPEVRKKISDSLMGNSLSEESRKKISKSKMGVKKSEETKRRMSEAKKNQTQETRDKISAAFKGRPILEETKLKMSEAHKGKVLSEETKNKMSKAKKGVPFRKVTCPHCGKIGGAATMPRWHFNNCKQLKEE